MNFVQVFLRYEYFSKSHGESDFGNVKLYESYLEGLGDPGEPERTAVG